MLKRIAPLLMIVAATAVAPFVQAHQCLTVVTHSTLDLNLADGTTITIVEDGPATAVFFPLPAGVCSTGVEDEAFDGALIISRDGTELCRDDEADPSFDPFAFGGGMHNMESESACAADFSAASIPNPLLPDAAATQVNPPAATVGTTRDVITDTAGSYRIGSEEFVIPQDTTGVSKRQIIAEGEL